MRHTDIEPCGTLRALSDGRHWMDEAGHLVIQVHADVMVRLVVAAQRVIDLHDVDHDAVLEVVCRECGTVYPCATAQAVFAVFPSTSTPGRAY